MNVLVLGGTGFIGSHLVDALLADEKQVRVLSRNPEPYRFPLQEVDYRFGDFLDTSLLAKSLESIDVVIHALSSTVPSTSNKNPKEDIHSNLESTVGLLDAMVKQGITRVIFLSSGGTVYGNSAGSPIPENAPLHPLSSYGIVKMAIEQYLLFYEHLHGLRPLIFRPSNIYGPRHGHIGIQGIISTFLAAMKRGDLLKVWGDGSIVRDYLYIDDFVDVCMKALQSQETGVFNIGAGVGFSIREIIECIAKIVEKTPRVEFSHGRAFDTPNVILDISKAKKVFNWSPAVVLEEGIERTWDWMKNCASIS